MCSVNTTTLETNVLLQHVLTQESHHRADYLRTLNALPFTVLYCIQTMTLWSQNMLQ